MEPEVAAAGTLDELRQAIIEPLRPENYPRMKRMWDHYTELVSEKELSRNGGASGDNGRPFQLLPGAAAEDRRPGDAPRRVAPGRGGVTFAGVPLSVPHTAHAPAPAPSSDLDS